MVALIARSSTSLASAVASMLGVGATSVGDAAEQPMAATNKAMPASLLSVRLMTIARSLPVLPCQPGFPKLQKNEMGIRVSSFSSWEVGFSGYGPECLRVPRPHGIPGVRSLKQGTPP